MTTDTADKIITIPANCQKPRLSCRNQTPIHTAVNGSIHPNTAVVVEPTCCTDKINVKSETNVGIKASNNGTAGTVSLKGLLLVLTTVVTYALYIVGVNKSCVHRMDGLKLTFYVLLAGAMVFGLNLSVKGVPLDPIPDKENESSLQYHSEYTNKK